MIREIFVKGFHLDNRSNVQFLYYTGMKLNRFTNFMTRKMVSQIVWLCFVETHLVVFFSRFFLNKYVIEGANIKDLSFSTSKSKCFVVISFGKANIFFFKWLHIFNGKSGHRIVILIHCIRCRQTR